MSNRSRSKVSVAVGIALGWGACALAVVGTASAIPEGRRVESKSPSGGGGYDVASVLSIGGGEADESAQFYDRNGRVDIGADRAGRIYVLDSGGPRIQVFDPSGRLVRSVGKEGEGPGELKMPGRIAVGDDGRLAVFDMGQQRISVFSGDGKLIRDQLTNGVVKEMAFDEKGDLVCVMGGPGGDAIEAFGLSGSSVWAIRPEAKPAGGRQIFFENDQETSGSRLVSSGAALFHATRDAYGVHRIADGKVESTWSRPFARLEREMPPVREPGEDDEGGAQIVIVRREGASDGDGAPHVSSSPGPLGGENTITLDQDDIQAMMPKYRPDVRGLLAWPDGRLWILTADDEGDNLVADEWTSSGQWTKTFTLPREYGLYKMGADGQLYAVSHDADDYPVVHRLVVTPRP